MKTKALLTLSAVMFCVLISQGAFGQEYESRYSRNSRDSERRLGIGTITGYQEYYYPAHESTPPIRQGDPHYTVIGWDPYVPLARIINTIKEGVTDQLTVLKLFSGPNIMWRNVRDGKETWIYHWLWSYKKEEDPNRTIVMMNHAGKKVRNNKTPVSMVITFNDKDIVESFQVKLLKVKHDYFDEY